MVLAVALAATLAFSPPSTHRRRKQRASAHRLVASPRSEWMLLTLAWRHAMLREFLIETGTETPATRDARIIDVGGGLRVGPTTIDLDFLGEPIVRARVRNGSTRKLDALLTAEVRDANDRSVRATTWVEGLDPGATRAIELSCPAVVTPASVQWTVTQL